MCADGEEDHRQDDGEVLAERGRLAPAVRVGGDGHAHAHPAADQFGRQDRGGKRDLEDEPESKADRDLSGYGHQSCYGEQGFGRRYSRKPDRDEDRQRPGHAHARRDRHCRGAEKRRGEQRGTDAGHQERHMPEIVLDRAETEVESVH